MPAARKSIPSAIGFVEESSWRPGQRKRHFGTARVVEEVQAFRVTAMPNPHSFDLLQRPGHIDLIGVAYGRGRFEGDEYS